MKERISSVLFVFFAVAVMIPGTVLAAYEKDTIQTSAGKLDVTFVGHGTLMLEFGGKVIHIDPFSRVGDYSVLPKADIIFLTHHHRDHLDLEALNLVRRKDTKIVLTKTCAEKVEGGMVMTNGDTLVVDSIGVEAVPAYNLIHRRDNGDLFHPPGQGNGYILTFADTRMYIAGDTENTPEMKSLKDIDYAFLPMNLPYTMTPEMVADAARAFRPAVLYPYHFGETDTTTIVKLLKGEKGIEVRLRKMP